MTDSWADDSLRVHAEDGLLGDRGLKPAVNDPVHIGVLSIGAWLACDRYDDGAVGFVKGVLRTLSRIRKSVGQWRPEYRIS